MEVAAEHQAEKIHFRKTASEHIFNFSWRTHYPRSVGENTLIEISNYSEVTDFLLKNGDEKYPNQFFKEMVQGHRQRYYETNGDFFKFTVGNQLAGIFVGTPIDWSSYYIRFIKVAPEFQNKKLYQTQLELLVSIFKAVGVLRLEADVAPSNLGHIHILNKNGFNVVGTTTSERWGLMLRFVKFLDKKSESFFLDRFCIGDRPQMDEV